jgi:prevent-host-death family protein
METVSIYDAKTRLSQLVDKAAAGEDVVVSRNGKPLVRITRLGPSKRRIKFGLLKGKLKLRRDFEAPLPAEALERRSTARATAPRYSHFSVGRCRQPAAQNTYKAHD